MPIPAVLYARAVSQALPALAAFRHGRALPPERRWIVAWSVLLVLNDAISLPLALQGKNNMLVGYVFTPLEVAAALIALALWHKSTLVRQVILWAIPVFTIVGLTLALFVEDTNNFSHITAPLKALLILSVSVATVLARIRDEEQSLLNSAWFWVCLGFSLRYGCAVGLGPLSSLLVERFPDIVSAAWKIQSIVDIIASLVIARGILCPIPPLRPSSGPSLQASSPSPSSSPRSAPPW